MNEKYRGKFSRFGRSVAARVAGGIIAASTLSGCFPDSPNPVDSIPVPTHLVPSSCNNLLEESILYSDAPTSADKLLNQEGCAAANRIAGHTVSLYLSNPNLFHNYADNQEYGFIMSDPSTGAYSEVYFGVNAQRVPQYNQLISVMVGNSTTAMGGAVSIFKEPVSFTTTTETIVNKKTTESAPVSHSGYDWDVMTEADNPHTKVPLGFDTGILPEHTNALQLLHIQQELMQVVHLANKNDI